MTPTEPSLTRRSHPGLEPVDAFALPLFGSRPIRPPAHGGPAVFELTSRAQSTVSVSVGVFAAAAAVGAGAFATGHMLVGFLAFAWVWAMFVCPTRLTVGRSGIHIQWLGTRTHLPYGDLERVGAYYVAGLPFGVELVPRLGRTIRLGIHRPALRQERQQLRTLLAAIAEAQTAAGFPSEPDSVPSVLPSVPR